MRLTRQADYAVRIVLDLTTHGAAGPIRSRDVSRRQRIPRAYFGKIVQALARSGLVLTSRGAGGGLRLAAEPDSLTLRRVVEAIEGPICLNRCLIRPRECPLDVACPVHPVWRRIQSLLLRELDAVTFAHLGQRQPRTRDLGNTPRRTSRLIPHTA